MLPAPLKRYAARLPLLLILFVGAFLRFYHLDVNPLRWDEILVPLTSHHSLRYIFDYCSTEEMHPPLFYLLTKAVLLFGKSDVALRFLSAVFGSLSIYLLYRIVLEFIDEKTALLASAFFSINLMHITISSEIRPYSLQIFLFLIAGWSLLLLIKRGAWRYLVFLCCVNVFLFWLHYLTFCMAAAQAAVLAFCLFVKSFRFTLRQFLVFCVATLLTAIPIYVWFYLPSLAHQIASQHRPAWLLNTLGDVIRDVRLASSFIFFTGSFWENLLGWAPLAGFVIFCFRKPKAAALSFFFGAIPLVIIMIMSPGYRLEAWHTAWTTPFLSLFAAMALSWLPWPRAIASVLAFGGALLILIFQPIASQWSPYWRDNPGGAVASLAPHPERRDDFRTMLDHLRPLLEPGALIAEAALPLPIGAMSWYLDQTPPNPLKLQSLEPGSAPLTLQFISGGDAEDHKAGEPYVRGMMGELGKVAQTSNVTVYTFKVDRQSVTTIDALPANFSFQASPREFYSRVLRLSNVTVVPGFSINTKYPILTRLRALEGGVVATQNNVPGFFEFLFNNAISDKPMQFLVACNYLNEGIGSRIDLFVRFDNEVPVRIGGSEGPDGNRIFQARFSRETPFKQLVFLVRMYCADNTARYFGDNRRTLVFQGLHVTVAHAEATTPANAWGAAAPQMERK